jgi:hypothetical protein
MVASRQRREREAEESPLLASEFKVPAQTAQKIKRHSLPAISSQWPVCLPAVARQWPTFLAPLFRLSAIMSQHLLEFYRCPKSLEPMRILIIFLMLIYRLK